jgi:tricorn protease
MTLPRSLLAILFTTVATVGAHAALPRFPQPFGDRVIFVADGNVWAVAKSGGAAERLTSAPGQDMFPRVSPDGQWIAYTEASKAGTDIWVIPAAGGAARRLTYHPTTEGGTGGRHGPDNMVVTWTPDSKSVVYLTKRNQWNSWIQEMYQVPVAGGAPTAMPIDSAVGLQPHLPQCPHVEALQRRPGATGLHLRLQQPPAPADNKLVGHQHFAHVV